MITRCYLEITNGCNLDCLFCPKTERKKHALTFEEFETLTDRLQGEVKFLYFHLMGEPLLHPQLPRFVERARLKGFVPIMTTNGTLFETETATALITAHPHKIQISLHSHEGNGFATPEKYVEQVMRFSLAAATQGILIVLRLWNEGGHNLGNELLHNLIAQHAPKPWTQRHDGWKLADNLYLEYDSMFTWPDEQHDEYEADEVFCYALRNQIGVLVDGTVVPCCLDHEGNIPLGNLFEQPLGDILSSPRAQSLYYGFTRHQATEDLCRRCGYASVSKQYRKR